MDERPPRAFSPTVQHPAEHASLKESSYENSIHSYLPDDRNCRWLLFTSTLHAAPPVRYKTASGGHSVKVDGSSNIHDWSAKSKKISGWLEIPGKWVKPIRACASTGDVDHGK